MKESLKSFIFFILFWLLFFAVSRVVFLISVINKIKEQDFLSILSSFFYALPMDLSSAAYLGLVPLAIWGILFIFKKNQVPSSLFQFYIMLLIGIVSLITIVDFNIYREWGTKVNYRVVQTFFHSPYLAMVSSSSSPVFLSILIWVILTFSAIFFYRKYKPEASSLNYPGIIVRVLFVFIVFITEIVILRGGISTSPLTQSSVYYSKNQALNHAAINTEWNLFRDFLDSRNAAINPYMFMSEQEAKKMCDSLLIVQDSTQKILTVKKPNIVLIILESFTADIIPQLGGEKGVTPFLDSLINKGLLFSNTYATGFRTDIGFVAIHTGFPSQPLQSILSIPEKARKLPSVSSSLYQNGYHTSFYYGGESEFFNFRAFILNKDYQQLTDIRDFEKKDLNSKWGAHDAVVFNRAVQDLKKQQEPFFSTIMTLSNHEPFEVPVKNKFQGNDLANKFRSTAFYTDQCLKEFFAAVSKESWYNNTLFVLVADHGHRLPKNENEVYMPHRSHIPMVFFGSVLQPSYNGKVINKTASQSDLPATLLAQLDITHKEFYWSKNLLNPFTHAFAFSTYNNGFVWMDEQRQIGYDCNSNKTNYNTFPNLSDSLQIRLGKAYLQTVYQEYLGF